MLRKYTFDMFFLASWLTVCFPLLLMIGRTAEVALSSIAVLFLIQSFQQKDWRWCKELWVQCLALLWLFMIARGIFSEHSKEAFSRSLPFVRYIIFAAALAYWILPDVKIRGRFFAVLTVAVIFFAADGLLQWCIGSDVFFKNVADDYNWQNRLTGPFSKGILGIMLAWLSFPVCLQLLITSSGALHTHRRFERILAVILVMAVIVLSGERMALILTLFGIVTALFILPIKKRYILGFLIAGIAMIALLALASHALFERQIHSTIHTLQHWKESPYGMLLASDLRLVTQHPLIGWGTNNFRYACTTLYPGMSETALKEVCNTHPHNIYIEWLIENGIVGLLLYISFMALIARKALHSWHKERLNPLYLGLLIAFILRAWPLASTTSFFSPWGTPPFWLVIGTLLVYTAGREEKETHADSALTI